MTDVTIPEEVKVLAERFSDRELDSVVRWVARNKAEDRLCYMVRNAANKLSELVDGSVSLRFVESWAEYEDISSRWKTMDAWAIPTLLFVGRFRDLLSFAASQRETDQKFIAAALVRELTGYLSNSPEYQRLARSTIPEELEKCGGTFEEEDNPFNHLVAARLIELLVTEGLWC